MAEVFARVVRECDEELSDRLAAIAARDVMRESQESGRQAGALLHQMTT